jgi:Holliday junction resolvase RusA-like endonuclease
MTSFIKFTVPGEPKGKGRPKFSRQGKFVRTYTPETTVNYENWVRMCFLQAKQEKLTGQLRAEINYYLSVPNSFTKIKKEEALKGLLRPTKKPDIDNVTKIIFDALNGMAYEDDKFIVSCSIDKWYDIDARTEIYIYEV